MRRRAVIPFAALCLALAVASAEPDPNARPIDAWIRVLEKTVVTLPDGSSLPVAASEGGAGLLDAEQVAETLRTIDEAEAWPATWLVLRCHDRDLDVVLLVRESAAGEPLPPAPVFAAERREWDWDGVADAARAATGKRPPREGRGSVVVQSFSRTSVTSYVYEEPGAASRAKGLLALLPEGTQIREAVRVDLGDGGFHTLAIVLHGARFLPSACLSCEDRLFGHADTGRIVLVLTGPNEIEDTLDLTPALTPTSEAAYGEGVPRVARFPCADGDEGLDPDAIAEQVSERRPTPLLALRDFTGDGLALEFSLPSILLGCGHWTEIVSGVVPGPEPKLRRYPVLDGDEVLAGDEGLGRIPEERVVETVWPCGDDGAETELRRTISFDPEGAAFRVLRTVVRECDRDGRPGEVLRDRTDPRYGALAHPSR